METLFTPELKRQLDLLEAQYDNIQDESVDMDGRALYIKCLINMAKTSINGVSTDERIRCLANMTAALVVHTIKSEDLNRVHYISTGLQPVAPNVNIPKKRYQTARDVGMVGGGAVLLGLVIKFLDIIYAYITSLL